MKLNKCLCAILAATLSAQLCAVAAIDGFDADGLPYAKEGFGVRRNFYQSGRISAKVSDIAGLFELNYVGSQPCHKQNFYRSAAENCHWMHGFAPYVLIDDVPYRLTFENAGLPPPTPEQLGISVISGPEGGMPALTVSR